MKLSDIKEVTDKVFPGLRDEQLKAALEKYLRERMACDPVFVFDPEYCRNSPDLLLPNWFELVEEEFTPIMVFLTYIDNVHNS